MSNKKFSEFAKKKIEESGGVVPEAVREAAVALEEFERMFGTEAVYTLVEKTCMEEMEKSGKLDPAYGEYLLSFLHEMKRESAEEKSN